MKDPIQFDESPNDLKSNNTFQKKKLFLDAFFVLTIIEFFIYAFSSFVECYKYGWFCFNPMFFVWVIFVPISLMKVLAAIILIVRRDKPYAHFSSIFVSLSNPYLLPLIFTAIELNFDVEIVMPKFIFISILFILFGFFLIAYWRKR